jgi:hypothetical protein
MVQKTSLPKDTIARHSCPLHEAVLSLKRWTPTARLPFDLLIPADE